MNNKYLCSETSISKSKTKFSFIDIKENDKFHHECFVRKPNMETTNLENNIYLVSVIINKEEIDDMAIIATLVNQHAIARGYKLDKYQAKLL